LKTSFREELKNAGACAVTTSVMKGFELGAGEYDFLGDADDHKLRWTGDVRRHCGFVVASKSIAGRAVIALGRVVGALRSWRSA
jgi:CelD/BcsL family acetyltransferase involved in cellulose biosynthesis